MLQLHDAKHFRFDGELKEDWLIVNTTNDTTFTMGRVKSIQTEDGIINPIFKGVKTDLPSLSFEIFKVNYESEPCQMTKEDLFELNRWLDRNEPKPLEVNGYIYYGVFSPSSGIWYPNKWGRVEVKFDMALPYMLDSIIEEILEVEGEEKITIENDSNVYNDFVYPDIEIAVLEGDTITITSLDNEQEIKLTNLKPNNVYRIYNQERQMVNKNNVRENIYANSNKKYINLEYGVNRFKITNNGNMIVKIIYQPKVCLQ